jgi:hypothetical protein
MIKVSLVIYPLKFLTIFRNIELRLLIYYFIIYNFTTTHQHLDELWQRNIKIQSWLKVHFTINK